MLASTPTYELFDNSDSECQDMINNNNGKNDKWKNKEKEKENSNDNSSTDNKFSLSLNATNVNVMSMSKSRRGSHARVDSVRAPTIAQSIFNGTSISFKSSNSGSSTVRSVRSVSSNGGETPKNNNINSWNKGSEKDRHKPAKSAQRASLLEHSSNESCQRIITHSKITNYVKIFLSNSNDIDNDSNDRNNSDSSNKGISINIGKPHETQTHFFENNKNKNENKNSKEGKGNGKGHFDVSSLSSVLSPPMGNTLATALSPSKSPDGPSPAIGSARYLGINSINNPTVDTSAAITSFTINIETERLEKHRLKYL